jgi:hypothetical protein
VLCFREFYYIQMEKYARQAVSEGVKNAEDLHVGGDSEIYRVLNLHYNRNNHIEVWGPQVRCLPSYLSFCSFNISLLSAVVDISQSFNSFLKINGTFKINSQYPGSRE